jgi:NADPH:quinone reductase-like Zn-dependent oxidoreductase
VGAQVLGLVSHAYAEFVVAAETAWAPLPAGLDLIDAAALPLVVLTGTQLIEEAVRPRPGEVVLVTGAVGSVGRAAVFAARTHGAEVIAGVRARQREEAGQLGVDVVALDDEAELQRLPPLDAIADTVGGETLQRLIGKVKPGGTLGSVLGEPRGAKERGLATHALLVHPDSARLATLAAAAAEGRLRIPIARHMPLADIRAAHTLAERGAGGKIVLRMP